MLVAVVVAGCGAADHLQRSAEQTFADLKDRAQQISRDAERLGNRAGKEADRLRDRLRAQVRETLVRIRQTVPAASLPAPARRPDTPTVRFLREVLQSVQGYWKNTLAAADIPPPHVFAAFPGPGESVPSGCGQSAGEDSAFYCPADDTIYIGQRITEQVAQGAGDFGAAFILAHEYAHNVQQELGWYQAGRRLAVKQFELEADCMAGNWANAVYETGKLDPGDIEEAQRTAQAVGDFDFSNPQHHGTPDERRAAWQLGFDSGDPAACRRYVPV
jgi:predicted metalloprotease